MDSDSIKKLNNLILKDEKNINKEKLQKLKKTTTKRMSIKFERKNPNNDKIKKKFKTK